MSEPRRTRIIVQQVTPGYTRIYEEEIQPPKPKPPRPYLLSEWHGPDGPKGYMNDDGTVEWTSGKPRAVTRWCLKVAWGVLSIFERMFYRKRKTK